MRSDLSGKLKMSGSGRIQTTSHFRIGSRYVSVTFAPDVVAITCDSAQICFSTDTVNSVRRKRLLKLSSRPLLVDLIELAGCFNMVDSNDWEQIYVVHQNMEDLVATLPCVKYCRNHGSREKNEQCAVCLYDFEEGEMVRQLNCKHKFHKGCVDEWLTSKSSCPLCRYVISVSDL